MNEKPLTSASLCLGLLRDNLDGFHHAPTDDTLHAPQAVALLSRMVFLCEAATDLLDSERRPAAAVLLRPAIECWIDCCYVMYCKTAAVLQLTSLGLREREKLARAWLGEEPLDEISKQLKDLDDVVGVGIEAGMLPADFRLRTSYSVEARLNAAIECRGSSPTYLDVYRFLYRGISTSEIHTSVAIDFHAEMSEEAVTFNVSPTEPFDVEMLIALTVRLACGAALDAFELLGIDPAELALNVAQLDASLTETNAAITAALESNPAVEVQRALDEIRRRSVET